MILIIGAGLSGLVTAFRLKKQGIPFKILEARSRIGGRIHTQYGIKNMPVEMGATWFTEQHNSLISLLNELEIQHFEQHISDTAFYQNNANAPAQLIQIPSQSPSYRIANGSSHLIDTLYSKLNPEDVLLNQTVTQIFFKENGVKVIANETFEGNHLVFALPPKLWAKNIFFEPGLPDNLLNIGEETHTWMEDSIKVALSYETAFWEEAGQSATLFSNSGPITELYDHCNIDRSSYALCGFMSASFKMLNARDRKQAVVSQLQNVFGQKAGDFLEYHECIWSQEEYTYTPSESLLFPHQNNGNSAFRKQYYNDRLFISSAESASAFAGYMDGAVSAGNLTAEKVIKASRI